MFSTRKFVLLAAVSLSLLTPFSFAKTEAECAGLKPPPLTPAEQLHCQQTGAACRSGNLQYLQCLASETKPATPPPSVCGIICQALKQASR